MSGKELMIGDKPLSSLRVVDLKEELEKRGLSKSGSKKDLADRLRNHVQLELQKEGAAAAAAAADEEQLPNISMQEKLAEQNPFIRDYFASQAQLFHSQKVQKKLIEEESRRESEASAPSADEGGESSAPEDKGLSSSEAEAETTGKVKKLAKRFENQNKRERNYSEEPEPTEITAEKSAEVERLEEPPKEVKEIPVQEKDEAIVETIVKETSVEKASEGKVEESMVEPVEKGAEEKPTEEADKTVEKPVEKPKLIEIPNQKMAVEDIDKPSEESNEKSPSSSASSRSRSRSRSPEEVESDHKSPNREIKRAVSESGSSSEDENEKEDQPKQNGESEITNTVNVVKIVEKLETNDEEQTTEKVISQEKAVEISVEEKAVEISVEEKSSEVSEDEKAEAESSSRSSSRSGSRSPVQLPKQESGRKREASRSPVKEPEGKVRRLAERFERKSREEIPETVKVETKNNASEVKVEKVEVVQSKSESGLKEVSSNSNSKPNVEAPNIRKASVRTTDEVEDEEALDYGEEEKIKSEPAKFDWSRRIIRVKNKHTSKGDGKKWARDTDSKVTENINTEFLTQYFPTVKLVSATDLRLEEKEASPPDVDNVAITRKFSVESQEGVPTQMENITVTRKVSLIPMVKPEPVDDDDKDLPPPRNPPSELIMITNLVRPFTLPQLKELLQRTGNLEEIWVDKIKSKCIAKYEKQEEAFETRAALHGVNWPTSNPKALLVDYSSQQVLDDCKARDAGDIKPLMAEKPAAADAMPVREWDVGKRAKSRSPNRTRRRSRSDSRDRKRSRKSPSPHKRRHSRSPHHDRRSRGDVKEPEPLGKALDELFRKTTTIPSIYWLPLTPGQIAEKEELRRKRMIERERRLAELNKIRPR